MTNRYRRWHGIAALVISCSSTTAWAQLPGTKFSPLNQFSRSLGFGVSDGYHECVGCAKTNQRPNDILLVTNSNLLYVAPENRAKPSIGRIDPFKTILYHDGGVAPGCSTNTANPMPMTVLPPSPQMYQQFAAPQSTPLPGASYSPSDPYGIPSQIPPASPWPEPSPYKESVVPDPVSDDESNRDSLLEEKSRSQKPETVPPPPPLRKRQKEDKPLGEGLRGNESLQPRKETDYDESLDLLPKSDMPPVTVRQPRNPMNSSVEASPVQAYQTSYDLGNARMLQEYYGNSYSQRQTSIELEAKRSGMNRYR